MPACGFQSVELASHASPNAMPSILPLPWFARGHLLRRSRQIASALTQHGLGWLIAQVGLADLIPPQRGWFGGLPAEAPRTQAEHFRLALSELGATFIKLGQALSTRPDLMPPDYIAELVKLQDDAPPVPFEQIRQVAYEELGQAPEDVFAEFDPQPIASASIGQAHAATLKNGRNVIVKVQRPGVIAQVEQDLEILSGMAEWAAAHSALGREYDLPALVDEFAYTLRNELNYHREGHNADRFRQNFQGDPGLYVPRVYWNLTTSRVITIERVGGIKITDIAGLDAAMIDKHAVAENSIRLLLRQIFEFGFFHADPHAGNCFVRPDGSIAMIDFGMVGRLDDRLQEALLSAGLAIARLDAERLTDELYDIGVAQSRTKRSHLQRDLAHLLETYASGSLQDVAAVQVANDITALAFRHRLQLPTELVMLLRVIAMSESTGMNLDPELKLMDFAAPYLKQFWLERRSPQAMAARLGQAALDATELSLSLPRHASRLLSRLERGDVEFNVNLESLRESITQMQRMTNRLALAIILGATIVALGLILSVYHVPGWDQYGGWLFGMGFVFSLGFGMWLVFSILRAGRG
jgi:ubiquinone biosynthesis protein